MISFGNTIMLMLLSAQAIGKASPRGKRRLTIRQMSPYSAADDPTD